MNFRKTLLALSVLGAAGMSGCGGSSHKHPAFTELEGVVIDDKLARADVCTDANRDAKCDASDDSVESNSLGAYSFLTTSPSATLLALGDPDKSFFVGNDSSDTISKPIVMRAPPASKTITPLSTLLTVVYEKEVATNSTSISQAIAAANAQVAAALDVPTGVTVDFTNYDYEEIASTSGAGSVLEFAGKAKIVSDLIVKVINQTYQQVESISDNTADTTIDLETIDRDIFDSAVAAVLEIPTGGTTSTLDQLVVVVDEAIEIAIENDGDASDVVFIEDATTGEPVLTITVDDVEIVDDTGQLTGDGTLPDGITDVPSADDIEIIDEDQAGDILDEVEDINDGGTGDSGTGGTGGTGAI